MALIVEMTGRWTYRGLETSLRATDINRNWDPVSERGE